MKENKRKQMSFVQVAKKGTKPYRNFKIYIINGQFKSDLFVLSTASMRLSKYDDWSMLMDTKAVFTEVLAAGLV